MNGAERVDRRTFLGLGVAVGALTLAAGTGVLAQTFSKAAEVDRQAAQLRISKLKDEISDFQKIKEEQGLGSAIARLTDSQDYLRYLGERMYKTKDLKGAYGDFFSESLKTADKEPPSKYGQHNPKFWEEIIGMGGREALLRESLFQLLKRITQHSAHFGIMGNAEERAERIRQLKALHGYLGGSLAVNSENSEAAGLVVIRERLRTEIDLGIFYSQVRVLAGEKRQGLEDSTGILISAWVERARAIPLMEIDSRIDYQSLALQSNPFI